MKKTYKVGPALFMFTLSVALVAIASWVYNAYKLFGLVVSGSDINAMFIGRAVGVFFAPLGSVLGFF